MDEDLEVHTNGDKSDGEKTQEHLTRAFLLECVEAARSEIAALKARTEGRAREEKLFRALARAQDVHWNKALMLLRGKTASTDENLKRALRSLEESLSSHEAMLDNTNGPARGLADQFVRTTQNHIGLLRQPGTKPSTSYHVCGICGFIAVDQAPERCPVCQALQEKFSLVD